MLNVEQRQDGLDDVIYTANQAGVTHFLCVSVEMQTLPEVLACAEKYKNVYASVGQHPNDIVNYDPSVEELIEKSQHDLVVAIGETGLDYFRTDAENTKQQQEAFRKHIQAAKILNKPIIIHTRQARDDTITIMHEQQANLVRGVMHCFTEDWAMAKKALDLDFYISFSGIVTFKNAKELQEVAKKVPSDRFLIETDSPYLAPVPMRGKPNEPAFVKYTANFLAELRSQSFEKIAQQSTDNFFELFKHARK
jgi:TatD DNase family protein